MNRILPALMVGAALGAAATLYVQSVKHPVVPAAPNPDSQIDAAPRAAHAAPPRTTPAAATSTRERSSLYTLAAEADATRLDQLLASAAAEPRSAARDFAIGVYLRRFLEVDALHAIEIARTLGVAPDALAALYGEWAARDMGSALGALRTIVDRAEARRVAVAILVALGNDEAALDKLAAVLPNDSGDYLRLASVELSARSSPDAAIDAALSLEDPLRILALGRVATMWAREDPRSALARADEVSNERLRLMLQYAVLTEWMQLDTGATLAYLGGLDETRRQQFMYVGGLQALAQTDPRRALEAAPRVPEDLRGFVEQTALQTLAAEDPRAALEYVERAGERREQLLALVAIGYGRNDPDAALAWARANEPSSQNRAPGFDSLVRQVIQGIASKDPNRAIDTALTLATDAERTQALISVVMSSVSMGGAHAASVAQRVLGIEDPRLRQAALDSLFDAWSQREPRESLDWLFASGADVKTEALERVAHNVAQTNPTLATSYTARVPAEARERWVRGVALGYAQKDPGAALDWVAQFRGEPAYDAGVAMIAPMLARQDPRRAADLVGSIDSAARYEGAVVSVASAWASTEPMRAAEWTLDLKPGRARDTALTTVARAWVAKDSASARSWVLRLPSGSTRDVALTGLVATPNYADSADQSLWNAFSDASARERAVVRAMMPIAARSAEDARALMERYVHDPDVRRQAEQMLEAAKNNGRLGVSRGVTQNIIVEGR